MPEHSEYQQFNPENSFQQIYNPIENLDYKFNPREWMMSTGHFERFEDPSSDETKVSGRDMLDDYHKIEPNVPEEDRVLVEALVKYVKGPLIVDKFASDEDRNAWQTEAVKQHPELNLIIENDKFRGNVIYGVMGVLDYANAMGWLNHEEDSGLIKRRFDLMKEYSGKDPAEASYHSMTYDEKIAFTKKMSDFAKDLYQVISKRFKPETIH